MQKYLRKNFTKLLLFLPINAFFLSFSNFELSSWHSRAFQRDAQDLIFKGTKVTPLTGSYRFWGCKSTWRFLGIQNIRSPICFACFSSWSPGSRWGRGWGCWAAAQRSPQWCPLPIFSAICRSEDFQQCSRPMQSSTSGCLLYWQKKINALKSTP